MPIEAKLSQSINSISQMDPRFQNPIIMTNIFFISICIPSCWAWFIYVHGIFPFPSQFLHAHLKYISTIYIIYIHIFENTTTTNNQPRHVTIFMMLTNSQTHTSYTSTCHLNDNRLRQHQNENENEKKNVKSTVE